MTNSDNDSTSGDGSPSGSNDATTGAQHAGGRAPRLFRATDDAAQGVAADDAAPQHPVPTPPVNRGPLPDSSQRFGAGTTYTGRGPHQPAEQSPPTIAAPPPPPTYAGPPPTYTPPPSPPTYIAPRNPQNPTPPASAVPPNPPPWQAPPPYATPPSAGYPYPPSSSLSGLWQRITETIDRVLLRGANNELIRQPWFDSIRYQNADLFVYVSYGAALLISLILGVGTASTAVMILLWGLWAGLAYLYLAVNTRLARQFLEYGICLVAVVVSAGTALAALGTLFGDGLGHSYPTAIAEGLIGLVFSVATGVFFGVVGLRAHRVPLAPPAPRATPHPFAGSPDPNAPAAPPIPPGYPNVTGPAYGTAWPSSAGGPPMPYPGYPGGGGAAIAASILSLLGALWFGFAAIGWAGVLIYLPQILHGFSQAGLKPGSPFFFAIALSAVQTLTPILLLVGGIQLLSRRLSGRRTITWGCVLLLISSAFWALAFYGIVEWSNALFSSFGGKGTFNITPEIVKDGLIPIGVPVVYAVITMICALSPSTRLWCRPPGAGFGPPHP